MATVNNKGSVRHIIRDVLKRFPRVVNCSSHEFNTNHLALYKIFKYPYSYTGDQLLACHRGLVRVRCYCNTFNIIRTTPCYCHSTRLLYRYEW